jgi:hypothetical protein
VQIRAHEHSIWIVSSLKLPVMHLPASMELQPDGQFTLPLDDSIAKVCPTGRDIALACRGLFWAPSHGYTAPCLWLLGY